MERELEKTLLEIEHLIDEHERRGNTHTQSVLQIAHEIIEPCAKAAKTLSELEELLSRENEQKTTRSSRDNDGWIPVEERLPIPNKEIWVTVKRNGKVFVSDDSMTEKGHFWNYEKENILAWKEKETIPEPYCPERIENTWKEDLLKKFDRRK